MKLFLFFSLLLFELAFLVLLVYAGKTNGQNALNELVSDFNEDSEREFWSKRFDSVGAERTYEEVKVKSGNLESDDVHTRMHIFGEILYEGLGVDGLAVCDDSFSFGCYHGFFGSAVSREGLEVLPKLDQACLAKFKEEFLPCQHGIGHGILSYFGVDNLRKALEKCRQLTWQATGGCSSGVFMEYNFRTITHKQTSIRSLDSSKGPYFPCDSIQAEFKASCYSEQPQWWQAVFKGDYDSIGELCYGVEAEDLRRPCFYGVGNYAVPFSGFDSDKTGEICAKMPDLDSEKYCVEGASWIFLADKGNGLLKAENLCKSLPSGSAQACLQKLKTNAFYEKN